MLLLLVLLLIQNVLASSRGSSSKLEAKKAQGMVPCSVQSVNIINIGRIDEEKGFEFGEEDLKLKKIDNLYLSRNRRINEGPGPGPGQGRLMKYFE